jgi:hypothetical protein
MEKSTVCSNRELRLLGNRPTRGLTNIRGAGLARLAVLAAVTPTLSFACTSALPPRATTASEKLHDQRAQLRVTFKTLEIMGIDSGIESRGDIRRDLVTFAYQESPGPQSGSTCVQFELALGIPPRVGERISLPKAMQANIEVLLDRKAVIVVGLRTAGKGLRMCGPDVGTLIWGGDRSIDCNLDGVRFRVSMVIRWRNIVPAPSAEVPGCHRVVLP